MSTAATIRADILEPTLDAQALNHQQADLVANRRYGVDSIAEVFGELSRTATPRQRELLTLGMELLRDLAASNRAECDRERSVAGAADQLAADIQRASHVTTSFVEYGYRRAARELRDPLALLLNPVVSGPRRDDALRLVAGVIDEAPASVLRSVSLRNELGVKRFSLLGRLVAECDERVAVTA